LGNLNDDFLLRNSKLNALKKQLSHSLKKMVKAIGVTLKKDLTALNLAYFPSILYINKVKQRSSLSSSLKKCFYFSCRSLTYDT